MKGSTMKASFKLIGASALALTLGLCGCGDKESGSGQGGGSAPSACATFKPLAGKDAAFAIGVNLDKEQAFKVVDAYADMFFEMLKLGGKEIAETREKIAAYKDDPFRDAPADVRAFLEKSGLRDVEFRWAVFSAESFTADGDKPRLDGLSLAVAANVDLGKAIGAIQEKMDGKAAFEETKIDGETAWHVVPRDAKSIKEMKDAHADPFVASLDGQLVLVAMSRSALEKQIRLYRGGKNDGGALNGFSASNGELMHLRVSGIGDLVKRNTSPRDLKKLTQGVPEGDELVLGLKDLDVDLKVSADGTLSDSLCLVAASEKDADKIRTLAKTGLMVLTAQLEKDPKTPKSVQKILKELKIVGTDGRVEIQGNGFSVGVIVGSLFPAVSSAMLNANASALAMNGRKLYVGMMQANVERMSAGVGSVWPRTKAAAGADTKDIAGRASASAFEYFTALFDMEHYGTSEWDPCVDGDLLSSLGKKGVVGKTISASGLDWCIAANVTDEMPDNTIVLVSANFNPALLLRKWDGRTDGKKLLPIGPKSGAPKSLLGDKAVVIVRKGGSAETIKQKFLTYDVLYRRQAFDFTNKELPLMYLTPAGVVEPVGHE